MTFAPNLNDFRFRFNQHIGNHDVEIVCERTQHVLVTKISIPYRDKEYDECTHSILIDFVPLHEITDLMATITAQVEKAREHLASIHENLQKYRPDFDALKSVADWKKLNLVNFYSLNVLMNARELLKYDMSHSRLTVDARGFQEKIANDQTVIELPAFYTNMSIFITIETDRPFGEIKTLEDFNYKLKEVRIVDKNIDTVVAECLISKEILEQLNEEMNDDWAIKGAVRRNLIFLPSAPAKDCSDLPF